MLSMLTYGSEEKAIKIANNTIYGLQAYVNSRSTERAYRIVYQIDTGPVMINVLTHDPLEPFGGFKQLGIDCEYDAFGLIEYLEPKTILA